MISDTWPNVWQIVQPKPGPKQNPDISLLSPVDSWVESSCVGRQSFRRSVSVSWGRNHGTACKLEGVFKVIPRFLRDRPLPCHDHLGACALQPPQPPNGEPSQATHGGCRDGRASGPRGPDQGLPG